MSRTMNITFNGKTLWIDIDSRKGALEFGNYVLNHMIRDKAKYFKPMEEVAA